MRFYKGLVHNVQFLQGQLTDMRSIKFCSKEKNSYSTQCTVTIMECLFDFSNNFE